MFGLGRSVRSVGSVLFCFVYIVASHDNIQAWFIYLEEYWFLVSIIFRMMKVVLWVLFADQMHWSICKSLFLGSEFSWGKYADLWFSYLIMHGNIDHVACAHNKHPNKYTLHFHVVHKTATLKLFG